MVKVVNPFIVTGKIHPEYFCDRIEESARLIKAVTNGNNLVIISPRRMGKTGLIQYCYEKQEISNEYYTFFIDILHTSSLREFTYVLGKEIYDNLLSRGSKVVNAFLQALRSISGKLGFDPVSGYPAFNLELGDITRPDYTLDEIFQYLSTADRPCIVSIDEFQQISKYAEKNIEALLRTHMQKLDNCNFIFAGSERHMMQEMFVSSARPFYHSADILELKEIPMDIYVSFVVANFKKRNRQIAANDVKSVYNLFRGHTYYMQKTFNEAFANTPDGNICDVEIIQSSVNNIIVSNDVIFREILSNMPEVQKVVLYAIAKEGVVKNITSSEFVKCHSLSSASSVQSAVKRLLEKDIVTEIGKEYSVTDKLFGMWINRIFGNDFRL